MDTVSNTSLAKRYFILVLVLIGVIASVALIATITRERIAANERSWFVAHLDALIPTSLRDNDLYADAITVSHVELLGAASTMIYRARHGDTPVGAVIQAIAPDGYGGPIELLIAVDYQGAVLGVEILRHSETPGIGDGFAPHRTDWLRALVGRSLDRVQPKRWTIRKDGGEFDQFSGASVTPRAILKAVRQALEYYASHREEIFRGAAIQR
jgi:Na+-translocating ferredoxin:NAD+ oxidoreductase subunit G